MRNIFLALILAFIPASAVAQQAVGNGGSSTFTSYYASTAAGSQTSGVSAAYSAFACNTGSTNCSSGALSFTVGTSNGVNNEWLLTVTMSAATVELSTETANFCIASASTYTILDATWAQNGSVCNSALTGRFAGGATFGNSALTAPGLVGFAAAHLLIANGATFSMTCNAAGSTSTAVTLFGFCSVRAEPY